MGCPPTHPRMTVRSTSSTRMSALPELHRRGGGARTAHRRGALVCPPGAAAARYNPSWRAVARRVPPEKLDASPFWFFRCVPVLVLRCVPVLVLIPDGGAEGFADCRGAKG